MSKSFLGIVICSTLATLLGLLVSHRGACVNSGCFGTPSTRGFPYPVPTSGFMFVDSAYLPGMWVYGLIINLFLYIMFFSFLTFIYSKFFKKTKKK